MAKHYRSFKDDYESLIQELEQDPYLGTDLGGGLRKIRMRITTRVKERVVELGSLLST